MFMEWPIKYIDGLYQMSLTSYDDIIAFIIDKNPLYKIMDSNYLAEWLDIFSDFKYSTRQWSFMRLETF